MKQTDLSNDLALLHTRHRGKVIYGNAEADTRLFALQEDSIILHMSN